MNRFDFRNSCVRTILFMGISLLGTGCEKADSTKAPATPASTAQMESAPDPQVLAILAKADAKDGTVDKTVSKCALCSFRMDGTPEHKTAYAGYTLHFCAPHCRESFEKDPKQRTLALKLEP